MLLWAMGHNVVGELRNAGNKIYMLNPILLSGTTIVILIKIKYYELCF